MIRCWMVFQLRDGRLEVHSHYSSSAAAACQAHLLTSQTAIHHSSIECILPRGHSGQRAPVHTSEPVTDPQVGSDCI